MVSAHLIEIINADLCRIAFQQSGRDTGNASLPRVGDFFLAMVPAIVVMMAVVLPVAATVVVAIVVSLARKALAVVPAVVTPAPVFVAIAVTVVIVAPVSVPITVAAAIFLVVSSARIAGEERWNRKNGTR